MKDKSVGKERLHALLPYGAALCAYIIFCLTGELYRDLDNFNVTIICNGLIGNNNFSQYTHPLLCLFFTLLKRLVPSADVYTALAHLLIMLALGYLILFLS